MPSIAQLRRLLTGRPNAVAAQHLGCNPSTAQRWRTRLGVPPYARGSRGLGTTEQALLAALAPPGSWHRSVALKQLRTYDVTYALLALVRKGLVQRRGDHRGYEYALVKQERE